jgi:Spy/CpxP family protein refolding chaperone
MNKMWAGLMSMVLLLAVAAGGTALAHGDMRMMSHSEDMVAHVNGMLQYVYDNVGADAAQKAKLAAISQAATDDLGPLHEQMAATHSQAFALLTQDRIDRTALENLRVEQMQLADTASKRITLFIADVADTLTPAQRKALADHFAAHHGG